MIMMKRILLAFFVLSMALSANAQRVYINPGHGEWGSEGRNMATITHAIGDTTGFWESNTNLWKAFALNEKLQEAGLQTLMSRTENGPYPYVEGDESIDRPLLDLGEEAEWWGATHYISIHSNAGPTGEDGTFANYPLYIYKGYDGEPSNWASEAMAYKSILRLYEIFDAGGGPEPTTAYSPSNPNLRGSSSFYGYTLDALNHSVHGYLAEGYFHTYSPARHRALNPDWCRQEGVRYFRGIMNYYDGYSGESVGHILGYVRSRTEKFSHAYYIPMPGTNDEFKPINGAKVVLRDASGNIIRTECYRHVARHKTDQYYYTTDNNYNGIFVFENLDPGPYTLTVHAEGYQDKTMTVDVTANATVYPEIFLEIGQGTDPNINVYVKWVLNGGTVDGTLPSTITEEYRLPIPYKAGYAFQGWYNNAEGTGTALTTLPVGYEGTLYAIWRAANVKWELNGGHISENKLLWEDFQNYFNEYYGTNYAHQPINNVLAFWPKGYDEYCKILVRNANYNVSDYWWLGDYLWSQKQGTISYGVDRYRNLLKAFLNCEVYQDDVTVDFTEAGKYDSWKGWATEEIRQKVTLPNQITSPYTIPTPEKDGATFQGWYDNPHGMGNPITELQAGYEGTVYAIWVGPVPCIVAYDLNCKYKVGAMAFDFSFYANTQPASGQLIFYNKYGERTKVVELSNLREGKNTVFMQAQEIPEYENGFEVGKDILWEVHLEARPSTLFAEIFRSEPFNTAYATIDNSPESDFFGSIWVANQHMHGYSNGETDGEIWRLVPEQRYAREGGNEAQQGHRPHRPRPEDPQPNNGGGQQPPQGGQPNGGQPQGGQPNGGGQPQGGAQQPPQGGKQEPPRGGRPDHTPSENTDTGFEVIFRPTVAPDGKVYLTDNGTSYGGVFVMNPHTKEITNFFAGCDYENGEWKDEYGEWKDENGVWKNKNVEWIASNDKLVGSGSTGAHIYWTEDVNDKKGFNPITSKLFLMHNDHAADAELSIGSTKGFFVYDLMGNTPSPQYTKLKNKADGIQDFVNTEITDYAIVGTSRGAWVCQLRNDKANFISHPSLTFYPSDNETPPTIFSESTDPEQPGGIFSDNELIHGSYGSAIAVSKDEKLLAMVGGTGNIMLFDITWNGSVPTLSNKRDHTVVEDDGENVSGWDLPTITTLNFDYAGNLVATLGETYNDENDKHEVAIFTLPKTPNHIDVPSRYSQRVPSLVEDDQCASIAIANKKYETVEIYRKMQAGMYNTICLPFGINSLKGTLYEGASVMEFVGTTIDEVGGEDVLKLNFQELTFQDADTMVAGVPYLIKPAQDITKPVILSGVFTANSVQGTSIKPTNSLATFHGITSPVEIQEDPKILFLVANNRLATASSTGMMMANRAYFELDNAQILPKRSIISIVKSTPAGLEEIYNTYQTEAYKMLYNGMIVIVRDGVMYDLMGTRIK